MLCAVEDALAVSITTTGLHILPQRPMFAASPDGICEVEGRTCVVEVKCPTSARTSTKYVDQKGVISDKVRAQMQLQMLATSTESGLLCVADHDFEQNGYVRVYRDTLDLTFLEPLLKQAEAFWFKAILPLLR